MTAEPPAWARALAQRLHFLLRDTPDAEPRITLAMRRAAAAPGGWAGVADRFPWACLDLLEAAAGRDAALRAELPALAALARSALAGDQGAARALARREIPAMDRLAGAAGFAIRVPGRAVFFAAMLAEMPDEQGPAVVMLVNDLSVLGAEAGLHALHAASLAVPPPREQ